MRPSSCCSNSRRMCSLLDVAMPRLTGLAALEQLDEASSLVRMISLTASISKADVVTALQLGARGVVLKDAASQVLFSAIRCVMNGHTGSAVPA